MKNLKNFLNEMVANDPGEQGGFGADATASGPVAGYTPYFFPKDMDDLSQDYQTPGQSGQAKWRFANVYPVQKLTLANVDAMVDASDKYVEIQDEQNENRRMKTFDTFMEHKKCPDGMRWDPNLKDCVPSGRMAYGMRWWGVGRNQNGKNGNGNGNGNGSYNGNGNGNGNGGGNGYSNGGNGGGGNGGGGISESFVNLPLQVEVPQSETAFNMGLMFRETLEKNSGMLFAFMEDGKKSFHMKNTTIPLDIAFINERGIIESIKELNPLNTIPVSSNSSVLYALEVNRGWFNENNVNVGDKILDL